MNVSLIDSLQQTSFDSQMCLIKRGNRMKPVLDDQRWKVTNYIYSRYCN